VQEDFSLGELAVRFALELRGDPDARVSHVATLAQAAPGSLSFLADSRHRRELATTRASAVVLAPADAPACPVAALVTENPRLAFAHMAALLHAEPKYAPGVHPTAVVATGVRVPASATVGALAVIEEDVELGERAWVGPGCIVQRGARVGEETRLVARVSLYPGVELGARCLVHAGAVIGADGFGFALDGSRWVKIPQVGSVRIGDDVEIGANTTIDRGATRDTVIGEGTKIDNLVQIGHNCSIGRHCLIVSQVGISGSVTVGDFVMIGGQAGVADHITIGAGAKIGARAGVMSNVPPGARWAGYPAEPAFDWKRGVVSVRRLVRSGRTSEGASE
jgi:UDP-3-O-[3-hydroxymyristoyl] glucosamine N-acyltransferase